jgi:DNA polymerase III subunit delta'
MSFNEIFCQDKAIDTLQRAFVADRAAHAYIFAGPDGVGKFKTAGQWGRLLLCSRPVIADNHAEACGLCESCRLFETGSHPDFIHIYKELLEFTKDGKDKAPPVEMPIDVIREFLIAKAAIKPGVSQKKVFVVSEAEKLNDNSQNALLKVLEEPPVFCSIILLCTRLDALLPTIRSRCQIVRFGFVSREKIAQKLQSLGLDDERCGYFARMASGSIGSACQWAALEQAEANLYKTKQEIVQSLAEYTLADVPDLAEELANKGKKIADVWSSLDVNKSKSDLARKAGQTLIMIVISALSDVMKLGCRPMNEAINADQGKYIEKLASRLAPEVCMEKVEDCYQKLHWVESNVNERLIWEHLLLSLLVSDTI